MTDIAIRTSPEIGTIAEAIAKAQVFADLLADGYWTSLPGFSRYLISAEGRIMSFQKRAPRIMRLIPVRKYLTVTLVADDGEHRKEYVHRLALEACDGPQPPGQEARHLNGNPHDNRFANLAWGTRTENANDRVTHGTASRGERNGMAVLSDDRVREMRDIYAEGGGSFKQIAAMFGVSTMTAHRIIRRKLWAHL